MSAKENDSGQGLVILSLDGGGVRGLSSLLILKECMTRLQHQLGLKKRPEVYEHFDIVGGTGTGGISAIMLGRLRIPLDRTIEHFAKLATEVFSEKKYLSMSGYGAFKSTKMQHSLKSIIRVTTGNENERMLDYRADGVSCKTVVFAMSKHYMNGGLPRAFRSYHASANQMPDCTIWEALCATTAHPDLFKSIDIGDESLKESFVDGGLGCNNPLARILAEVKLMYPNRRVACVISIGAGHGRTIHIPSFSPFHRLLPTSVIEVMKGIAMDSEQEAERMAIRFNGTESVYFRLNVDQGMQSVELGTWERLSEVTAHTRGYMQHAVVSKTIEKSAEAIRKKLGVYAVAHIDGEAPATNDPTKNSGIHVCPPPTSLFVGREEPVQRAVTYLLSDALQRKIYVIHGLGGAGKTQMALRIVEKTRKHWSDVIFVDAASVPTIESTLRDFATRKCIGDSHQDTLRWLSSTTARWLLLIDNVDDPGVNIVTYLPEGFGGHILVTTRNQDLVELAPGEDSHCNVSSLEPSEGLQLLLKASRRENKELPDDEMCAANQLLEDFGCLPLAITQAGGYIHKNHCTFAQYLELYLKQPAKMMQKHNRVRMQLNRYERTTFDTWMISYELLNVRAQRLLWSMAYMQRDRITVEIFQRATANINKFKPEIPLSESDQGAYDYMKDFLGSFHDYNGDWDLDAFLTVMSEIMSYSLIGYDLVNKAYVLHPLVQTWARTVAPQHLGGMPTVYLLAAALNWIEFSVDYTFLRALHLHVTGVLQLCQPISNNLTPYLARVLYVNGQWGQASLLQSHVVDARLQVLGENHSSTLWAKNYLAITLSDQGRQREAEELRVQVLEARKQVLGEEHPDTLIAMNNLANTYANQGRQKEAEELRVQVLEARKRVLGKGHPDTLIAMNNLANTYADQGRQKEAEELRVQVLEARKRVLGEEHPDTLSAMSNLANTYADQGRQKEAEELQVQVLEARKRVHGEEHPDTLSAMNNLADTYRNQGRHKQAEELQVQVLEARKQVLGKEHPDTLSAMNNLANTYADQGRQKEAEELQVQVLEARKRVLGKEHPDTLSAMNNLANTYADQGRQKEAEELQVQVLEARKRVLGKEHPATLMAMNNLAVTYADQGRHKEAEELRVQVLEARKRVLGEEHPDTLGAMYNLAHTYKKQGRQKKAGELGEQVVTAMKRVLGEEHPKTLAAMNNLSVTYRIQGRLEQAAELQTQVLDARRRVLGPEHPDTARVMRNLAATYKRLGEGYRAEYEALSKELTQIGAAPGSGRT